MISAAAVNELRQRTGAGIMDCKKALLETKGDFEDACQWLRKKGLAAAAKKSGRVTAEGLVTAGVSIDGRTGAIIELNSETDFVAKNSKFQSLCTDLTREYLKFNGNLEDFKKSIMPTTQKSVETEISEHIAIIGENISLRRCNKISVTNGVVVNYIHNQVAPNLGKIAVLVGLETNIDTPKVQILGKQIAMHIAAVKPESLNITDLDQALVKKERDFITEQASNSGKPQPVIDKMVEGRLSKFYEQVVLNEQTFVMDGQNKISEVLANFAKDNNGTIKIKEFIRYTLGEGIEKEQSDLAKDVAALTGH